MSEADDRALRIELIRRVFAKKNRRATKQHEDTYLRDLASIETETLRITVESLDEHWRKARVPHAGELRDLCLGGDGDGKADKAANEIVLVDDLARWNKVVDAWIQAARLSPQTETARERVRLDAERTLEASGRIRISPAVRADLIRRGVIPRPGETLEAERFAQWKVMIRELARCGVFWDEDRERWSWTLEGEPMPLTALKRERAGLPFGREPTWAETEAAFDALPPEEERPPARGVGRDVPRVAAWEVRS